MQTLFNMRKAIESGEGVSFQDLVSNWTEMPELKHMIGADPEMQMGMLDSMIQDYRGQIGDALFSKLKADKDFSDGLEDSTILNYVSALVDLLLAEMDSGISESEQKWREFLANVRGDIASESLEGDWEVDSLSSVRNQFMSLLEAGDVEGFV